MCVAKKRIKRKRMMMAVILLFSFIVGLTSSGFNGVYAEDLNSIPIVETAADIVESPVEPTQPAVETVLEPTEVVIEAVEEPVEIPPEVVPPEVVPPEVEIVITPAPIIEEPILPDDLALQEEAALEPPLELEAAADVGITAVPTGGDYSLVWSAADAKPNNAPYLPTYDKLYPYQLPAKWDRQTSPLPHAIYGEPKDSVQSLQPSDMMLGQIVPFELLVTVGGTGTDGVILVTPYWLTKTTSGEDFGFDPTYMVYAAFVDYDDTANIDNGVLASATLNAPAVLVNSGTSNEQIQGTLRISGLDAGDEIVVEIWVVLKSGFPAGNITGNIQTGMVRAQTVTDETVNVGNKTVPLSQVGLFESVDTEVSITKDDSPDPLFVDEYLTYTITVQNNTIVAANGIVVTDTLDPFVSLFSADGGGTLSGQDVNGYGGLVTWPAFSLAPNISTDPTNPSINSFIEFTLVVHVSLSAPTDNVLGANPDTYAAANGDRHSPVDVTNIVRIASIVTDDTNLANNVYQVATNILRRGAATSLILNATKVLTGKDLTAGMFNFSVLEGTAVVATGTNDSNGDIAFTPIQYNVAGSHTYTVVEDLGTLGGIDYSEQWFTVTVSVVDNLAGSLVATPTYPTGGVVFDNSYTTSPTSIILRATKALTGRTLAAGMFNFELRQITTEGYISLQTKPNGVVDNVATISFDPIEYTMADRGKTFNYTITEKVPAVPEPGMYYDPMVLAVSVQVIDNGDGTLTASATYQADTIFNNEFRTGELQIRKVDDSGNPILGHEATFELRQGATVIMEEMTDITTGIATFEKILIGTYTLVETDAPTGYELNQTVYTVIVQSNSTQDIEVIVKTGGADGTNVPSAPLVVTDKELGSIIIEKLDSLTSAPLSGAEFDLYREVPSGTAGAAAFTMLDSTVIYGIKMNAASLITGTDGKTPAVGNLVQGNYFTVETKAPIGYDLLEEPVRMTLQYPNLTMTYQLNNSKSPQIPQTGGVGTMIFSIVGIGLMSLALLGYKKYNTNGKNKNKGENIMKGRKFFTILLTFLVLFVFIAPTMSKANASPVSGSLTLHKFEYSSDDNVTPITGTGMPGQIVPTGATALPGVVFRVTRVADNAVLPDPSPLMQGGSIVYQHQENTDPEFDTVDPTIVTKPAGLAIFGNLPMGRYFVEEISQPANVTTPTPDFLVDIPMMNTNQVEWNWDVHVYPKNETKYGTVELTKTIEGMSMTSGFATFVLWMDKDPDPDVRYPNDTTTYSTNSSGYLEIKDLPVGKYYLIETVPPVGYALDNTPIPFEITKHAYRGVNGQWVDSEKVTMDDKLKPTIDKDIEEPGTEKDSGGYADPVTWIIRPSIPTQIGAYTSFVVTDALDSRLDFITDDAELVVSTSGQVLIRDTDYSVTEPIVTNPPSGRPVPNNLVITFTEVGRAKLEHELDLQIRFKTTINATAVMGAEIPNTATVSYNNGFGQTGTATVPTDEIPVAWTGGYKFLKTNVAQTPLLGAEFIVYRLVGTDPIIKEYFTGTAWTPTFSSALVYDTAIGGIVDIKGLPAGTYFLLETKAPWNTAEGVPYNLLTEPIEFEVTQNSYDAVMTNIVNKMGPKIPQTGGIGTLLFTITGLGLMGSAMMIGKKKSTR